MRRETVELLILDTVDLRTMGKLIAYDTHSGGRRNKSWDGIIAGRSVDLPNLKEVYSWAKSKGFIVEKIYKPHPHLRYTLEDEMDKVLTIQETMKGIREIASNALKEAEANKNLSHFGSVNWGDLRIVSVVFCENEEFQQWYRVDIEEADSSLLSEFIANRLADAGFPEVEVLTEW